MRARLRAALDRISENPEKGKRLRGELAGLRSWRVGAFRIIYAVSEDLVSVIAIGRRSDIYR